METVKTFARAAMIHLNPSTRSPSPVALVTQPSTTSVPGSAPSASPSVDAGAALALARELLTEIALRWPGQAGRWATDHAMAGSWAMVLLEVHAVDQPGRLHAALARLSDRPFPPDLGALLDVAKRRISMTDAAESLRRTLRALALAEYHTLTSGEWWAARRWGITELRAVSSTDAVTLRWAELLTLSDAEPDLPAPPPAPVARIERKRTPAELELGRAHLAAFRALLAAS